MPEDEARQAQTSSLPELVVLDTNCFIYAADPESHAHSAVNELLAVASRGELRIGVSLHTASELAGGSAKDGGRALALADGCERLPYFPVGTINELLGPISGLSGTLADMDDNEELQQLLRTLAKAGTSLADRGALVDALRAGATAFVTSDGQLVRNGPRSRIERTTGLRILTPDEALTRLPVRSLRFAKSERESPST